MRVTLRAEGTPRQSDLYDLRRNGAVIIRPRRSWLWRCGWFFLGGAPTMGELGSRIVRDRWTAGGLAGLDEICLSTRSERTRETVAGWTSSIDCTTRPLICPSSRTTSMIFRSVSAPSETGRSRLRRASNHVALQTVDAATVAFALDRALHECSPRDWHQQRVRPTRARSHSP